MTTEFDPGALKEDTVCVRTLEERDLEAIVRIDASEMSRTRREFFRDKVASALHDSRLHTSLVAELDGILAGFLMARQHYGEFGRVEPTAVIEALGVHKDFRGKAIGRALMRHFLMNAKALGVESVHTEVAWNSTGLIRFFDQHGFAPAPRIILERSLRDGKG